MARPGPRITRPWVAVILVVALLSGGGFLVASAIARQDRRAAAARRAGSDRARAQILLERAKADLIGLGALLGNEPAGGQQRFAFVAGTTTASLDLVDALWITDVRGAVIARYATTLSPGTDVSSWPAIAAPIRGQTTVFAATATTLGSLHGSTGFFLLESARFGRGPGSAGYLALFVPSGWMTLSIGDDPRGSEIMLGGHRLEGELHAAPAARASFAALGQSWRVAVGLSPATGLDALLPWIALGWPCVARFSSPCS